MDQELARINRNFARMYGLPEGFIAFDRMKLHENQHSDMGVRYWVHVPAEVSSWESDLKKEKHFPDGFNNVVCVSGDMVYLTYRTCASGMSP